MTGPESATKARDPEADRNTLRAIHATLTGGDPERAGDMAIDALRDGLEHPMAFSLAASRFEETGQLDEALALLEKARVLAPDAPGIANALGLCLQRLDRHDDAVSAFDAALVADPAFVPAITNRAGSLAAMARLVDAKAGFEAAQALQPDNTIAANGLAALAMRRGDAGEAATLARRVLAQAPNFPPAATTMAEAEIALGQADSAETRMRDLLAIPAVLGHDRAVAQGVLADSLDAQQRFDEAWRAYKVSGETFRALHAARFSASPRPRDFIADLVQRLRGMAPGVPTSVQSGPARRHVFLIGFPRSGTTLLEQVLEQHPDVVTLAEKECLIDSIPSAIGSLEAFDRFAALPDAALQPMRDAYWARVRSEGIEPAGGVFVDKHPFHSFKLPMIAKLFPDATILFAQRDPRDAVLSCFRRRFVINGPTFEFLDPAATAQLYDAAMALIEATALIFPQPMARVRLEDLTASFEPEVSRICAAIGIEWSDSMRDFATGSRERGVFTPSGAQIAGGLRAEGQGRWRDYADGLAPAMQWLEPWIERYGYA